MGCNQAVATIVTIPKEIAYATFDFNTISEAIRSNSQELTSDIASSVSEHVNKELDFLFREKEESDEKRYRQLDETIRSYQRARQEAAATHTPENKSKNRHFFGKK